jgi:hypothetical protein
MHGMRLDSTSAGFRTSFRASYLRGVGQTAKTIVSLLRLELGTENELR